jgi:hypothetical protein
MAQNSNTSAAESCPNPKISLPVNGISDQYDKISHKPEKIK